MSKWTDLTDAGDACFVANMPDVMTKKFMDKYGRSGTCGDSLSDVLAKYLVDEETGRLDEVKFQTVADTNMVAIKKWKHLNNGQRRMLLGNVLRGQIRRGATVTIGEDVLTSD